jgi:hypothetical protein
MVKGEGGFDRRGQGELSPLMVLSGDFRPHDDEFSNGLSMKFRRYNLEFRK